MAGEKNLLNKLARQAGQFDENALASFANKGLLRRARKDFDADANIVALESADDKSVKLRIAESTVTLTEKGLTESVCDCSSTETCRHILIACFWLATQTVESEQDKVVSVENGNVDKNDATVETSSKTPEKPAFQDLLDIAFASLEKVAGKKVFAQAVEFFNKNPDCKVSIAAEDIRLIEFEQSNVAVRLLKDADVESHLCSCRSAEICRHKIAAILAFRRENNVETLPDSIDKGESAFKLSESQIKVLGKTIKLFAEFVEIGASHLSESSVER
ncbi:MAG: SWIM zinc finger family protein, partial [Pyrinomonadaceae bacterium]|nr:SWIM zinc finger family protein [Pyrinomonadaceae bacterium]